MASVYRRTRDGDTWHFCSNCSNWPTTDFVEQRLPPSTGEMCNECTCKRRHPFQRPARQNILSRRPCSDIRPAPLFPQSVRNLEIKLVRTAAYFTRLLAASKRTSL